MSEEYPAVPKPDPTPIFDRWKRCPDCDSEEAELRVEYLDSHATTSDPNLRVIKRDSQKILVHFFCASCGLESEHRGTLLDDLSVTDVDP